MDLSIASQIAISFAAGEAQALGSKYIDTEHMFLGLCKIGDILFMGREAIPGLDERQWEDAGREIQGFMEVVERKGLDPKNARRRFRGILRDQHGTICIFSGHRTERCKEVFDTAEKISSQETALTGYPVIIKTLHLLYAILGQSSQPLDLLLSELLIGRTDLLEGAGGTSGDNEDKDKTLVKEAPRITDKKEQYDDGNKAEKRDRSGTPLLDKFGRDITQLAREGKIDPAIGREKEIKEIAQILMQKKKNNPILVGEAGVGKTAIVEGFALKVVQPDAPLQIKDFRVVELSMGTLIAGTKYRGEFEERLETLLKEASSDPNVVIFIDEIHTMVGAGAGGGNALDAGNILKPALARGTIKCIGATTTAEYRKYIEKDPALERRFQIIWIDEPNKEEAIQILKGLRPGYERHHKIKIPDDVIEKAVELSMRYLIDFRLPDKAIDVIDQACTKAKLKTFSPGINSMEMNVELELRDIALVVSKRCRIPLNSLTTEDRDRLLTIDDYLKQRVIGQDHAVNEIGKSLRSAKAGLKDPNKPLVFLLAGSTGTGKTELAKALTEFLFHDEKNLIVFDMSEYQEKHALAKLIGAPPGYAGYDDEGQLTGKLRSKPYSVVLFDEIEKAHPDIFSIFLQIFDEGRLTDAHGRKINFSEAIIILTSNLGSSRVSGSGKAKRPIGIDIDRMHFDANKTVAADKSPETTASSEKWREYEIQIQQAITGAFRPEFLNRIQKRIIFYPLGTDSVKKIISQKILNGFNERLVQKGIKVDLADSVLEFLINKGYNEDYGAREINRTFEQYISEPLSQMILKGEIKSGQCVDVSALSGEVHFKII